MKTGVIVVCIVIVLSPIFSVAQSPLPKNGKGTATNHFTGTFKSIAMGEEHLQVTYETFGIATNDAGQGFLHNASGRCVGSLHAVRGVFDNERGMCAFADRDGDQIFMTYTGAGNLAAGVAKGKATYVGGTGKYASLTGMHDFTRIALRPAAQGTTASVNKVSFEYKLP